MYVETGEPVEIVARHQDAEEEYFTIRLPDGREKQTEAARLRLPKGSRALEEELALVSQVRPTTTAILSAGFCWRCWLCRNNVSESTRTEGGIG